MEYKQFISQVKKNKQAVVIAMILFLLAALLLTFFQPLKFSAESRLLVVQNYGPNTDAYNVSRSNQFLSSLLAQVVYSDSFYEKVMASGYNLNPAIFSADINKRKKDWQNSVYTKAVADTGMIVLKTYHQDKSTADRLNQAIAFTLMTKHAQFHGLGEIVQVKIIDNSTLSDWPVKPNIILNLLLALILGLAAGLYYVYLFAGKNYEKAELEKYVQEPPAFERQTEFIAVCEPELAYEPAYRTGRPAEVEPTRELELEEADDDELEPFFRGNINNVLPR